MCYHVNAKEPKLPNSKSDPIGNGKLRARSAKSIKSRLKKAKREVMALFSSVPYSTRQVKDLTNGLWINRTYYVYEMDANQLANFDAEIRDIINRWMETTGDNKPPRWFFDMYINESSVSGTSDSLANMQRIAPSDTEVMGQPFSAVKIEQILLSSTYRDAIEMMRARTFNDMKGFSGETAKQLSQVFQSSMAAGEGVNEIKAKIRNRFDVADSRAERIARTEVNKAYTDSRMNMSKQARDDLGLRTAVMHISALAATSRREHVRRSGNTYTPEQQERWWNSGSNRINCLCSISEVMIDKNGNVLNKEFQKAIKGDKKEWVKDNAD